MRKTVTISPIPLTEGLSKLYLHVEDGIIIEGYYYSLIPVRGYETLLIGKEAPSAPILASRICGLCQITHAIASAKAIENACDIEVSEKAELLRESLGLAVRIYNNLLHQIVISEDLFDENADERLNFIREVQKVRKIASEILESIGGEIIHSPNIRVGGISEAVEDSILEKLVKSINIMIPSLVNIESRFLHELDSKWTKNSLPELLGSHNLKFFSSDKFYGKKVDISRIEEKYPQEFFKQLTIKREASNRIPLIDGEFKETGPRARRVIFDGAKTTGGIRELYKHRSRETIEAAYRIKEIFENNSFNDKEELWNRTFPHSDNEKLGIGVHEAPRGTNIHAVRIDKRGKISYYRIIVPTAINFPVISEALKGEKVEFAEFIVRAYDPCIVCASH